MTLLNPIENTNLYGHDALKERFLSQYSARKLHHGHILLGPKGVGKATFVYHFIRHVLTHDDPSAPSKITQNSHPNLLIIEREFDEKKGKKAGEIKVDDIKPLFDFLQQTSTNKSWRFVVIDEADKMNRSVQNRILKILEEPPKDTVIFLLAENKQRLLPTIISRCQTHALAPLSYTETQKLLSKHQLDDAPLCAALAEGCYGYGLELAHKDITTLWQEWADTLDAAAYEKQSSIMDFCENYGLAKNDESYQLLLNLIARTLTAFIRANTKTAKDEDNLLVERLSSKVQDYFSGLKPLTLLNLHDEAIKQLREGERSYLDRKILLLNVIEHLFHLSKSVAA